MIAFQTEKMETFFRDGQVLFPQHYAELALNQDSIKLELDEERYLKAEQDGCLCIATARDDGRLVGYFVSAILRHLHYASLLCAHTDMYYLLPAYRNGCGAKLLLFVEDLWRKLGAKKAYLSCKVKQDHSEMFKLLGFELSDYFFVKML